MGKKKGMRKGLHGNSVCHAVGICSPACFFCIMKEENPTKRHAGIVKYLKEMPTGTRRDEHNQVLVVSALWNIAMARPNDPELPKLGILDCMSRLIRKGLKDRTWLLNDQNVYIPYYAAHVIGSYTMNVEAFAEMAVEAGVVSPLVELLRGRLTWVEQRVAVRALGHLATYKTTFHAVFSEEVVQLAMELSSCCLEIVYTQFIQCPSKRLSYHCDLLTKGIGGAEMEKRKAEEWASQLQCWSLHLLNCFAYRDEFVPVICKPGFLNKLPGMWGGLVNENSPAGVGLLRILCYHKVGRSFVSDCSGVIDSLCNVARSSDDWQYMAIDCLLLLLKDHHTRSKVIDKAVVPLVDLAEMETVGEKKRVGEVIIETLLKEDPYRHTQGSSKKASLIRKRHLDELWNLKQRMKWEKTMSREDLHVKKAAAMVVKLEGNSKFSCGDLKGAVTKYTEALTLCPLKIKKERVVLYSNRAQCHLLLHDPDSAISDTTRALSISNPVNSHSKSLWRRAQAYDIKGFDKESLLDAIMFINECFMPDNNGHKDNKYVKVPYYATQLVRKKMHTTWLFRDAALKHGKLLASNGLSNESKSTPSASPSSSQSSSSEEEEDVQEEEGKSEWETVSDNHEEETINTKNNHQPEASGTANANGNGKNQYFQSSSLSHMEEEIINTKNNHQPEASGTANANGNGKNQYFQSSSLSHMEGLMVNNQSVESKTNESEATTSVNHNANQGQVNSGAMIMMLPTIKEEVLSEEERKLEQKKKWVNTAKHEYMTMLKNKRIQGSTSRHMLQL